MSVSFSSAITTGDILTVAGFLVASVAAHNGLTQWRADSTVRLIEEYSQAEIRDARSLLRRWMRELGADVDWSVAVEAKFTDDEQFVSRTLGALNRYYNRVGILLDNRALIEPLMLGEIRSDVAIFKGPIAGWLAFTTARRTRDLELAGLRRGLLRDYWRGTRGLLRRCG